MLRLVVASNRATIAPDGWTLLQQTRAQFGVEAVLGVGLDHVVFASASIEPQPVPCDATRSTHSNPFHATQPVPRTATRLRRDLSGADRERTGCPGSEVASRSRTSGRHRAVRDDASAGRRPVVAILDTGCGKHPWLDGVVDKGVELDGITIGYDDAARPTRRSTATVAGRSTG